MLHFALEELDFFGGELEQGVDAVVDFVFGGGEFAGEALDFLAVLGQVGIPFVSRLGRLERVGGQRDGRFDTAILCQHSQRILTDPAELITVFFRYVDPVSWPT